MRFVIALFIVLIFTIYTPMIHAKEKKSELLIGLIPEENIFRQMDRFRPLAGYLTKKLDIKVSFTILSRYGDIIDNFTSRGLDGAFFGAFTSVLAMEKLGVEPIVRPENPDGTSFAEGYLFVRRDSEIKDINSMKGKVIAFVDKATATGYIFAIAYLKDHGIYNPEKYFKKYFFTGSHDSTLLSVLDGRADIGVAKNTIIKKRIQREPMIEKEIRVIARSMPLPDITLCLSKNVNQELKEKIKRVLLEMNMDSEGRQVLEKLGASRFITSSKEDFLSVYNLLKKAGIDIKTYKYR